MELSPDWPTGPDAGGCVGGCKPTNFSRMCARWLVCSRRFCRPRHMERRARPRSAGRISRRRGSFLFFARRKKI